MNQTAIVVVLAIAALLSPNACAEDPEMLTWEELPPLPDSLGVAGPFAGVHNDALIVAGGANFPLPVWQTEKVWRDEIHVLVKHGESYVWKSGGRLPRPIAYGAAVSTPEGVVCMGGNDSTDTFTDVFLLSWDAKVDAIITTKYPALPKPCAFGAATVNGDVIFLAGGQSGQTLNTAMCNFWSLDLAMKHEPSKFVWKELGAWPGPSRALNVTVSQHNGLHDCVYVISGRRQEGSGDDPANFRFLRDVWEYTPATTQWRERTEVPRCVMAGTGIGVGKSHILVLGGATEELYFRTNELQDDHPGFIKESLAYDTATDIWTRSGTMPANHVTTIAVKWNDAIIIPSGEVRPRVRSPSVFRVRPMK